MRQFTELIRIFSGRTVSSSQPFIVDTGFPFGGLIRKLNLVLHFTVDINSDTGLSQEGLKAFVRNILFRGGNDHFVKNVCGKALFEYAQDVTGTSPGVDTVSDADGTYSLSIPLLFADDRMLKPNDTAIDARRYASTGFHFEITAGSISDLVSSHTDGTVAVTADLYAEMEQGLTEPIGGPGMPKGYRSYEQPAPIDPSATTIFELEKNVQKFYRRFLLQAANSATAGLPFSGTPANTTLANLTFQSNIRTHMNAMPEWNLRQKNKEDYQRETVATGRYIIDLVRGGSNFEMLNADPKLLTTLQIQVGNGTLSTSQVSAMLDAYYLYLGN
jgi:hypothetical protein